ncbi:hypothetical protein IJT10_06380 [bacterium]|nr:hypothetical protein [bacterium]
MADTKPSCPSQWLGQIYSEALRRARVLGEAPQHVVISRPPVAGLGKGELRVIGVRACQSKEGEEWILAYPNFQRIPRQKKK